MILVDTSVWIDFLRGKARASALGPLLESGDVLIHPWVIGELALGELGRVRDATLADLRLLPMGPVLPDDEVVAMIEKRRLWSSGIGWVDAQLVGSALVARCLLWSHDKSCARLSARLGIAL